MSGNFKKDKMQEKIQFFSLECIRNLPEERLRLMSITKVEISSDFSSAKVFWDTFDSSNIEKIKNSLNFYKGKIRTHVGKGLKIKHTPSLEFFYDNQFAEEQKITQILKDEGHFEN